jgi:two-component system sensor histidine kinase KdpD
MVTNRRSLAGAVIALGLDVVLALAMLPLRSHMSVATPALVLVVPVVAGVSVGGFRAGVTGVVAGLLVYDVLFIPPYDSLSVGTAQNWAALGVYVVVMLAVSRVAANLERARSDARLREADAVRLFELSDRLTGDARVADLLEQIVSAVQDAFSVEAVALLLPAAGGVEIAAAAGEPLTPTELATLAPGVAVQTTTSLGVSPSGITVTGMSASGRPVGVLVLRGANLTPRDRELLRAIANHAALAIERGQLRDQAMRTQLLEEVDKWRGALMGAVSHDLRTPLASIKASVSDLRDGSLSLSPPDRAELLELVETQTDRLARLVTNLLDMTRIETGTLALRRDPASVPDLVDEALASLEPAVDSSRLKRDLPLVDVDHVLIAQVIANLLDNAFRYSPEGEYVVVAARAAGRAGDTVEISVTDHGPGIAADERERVFQMYNRVSGGGRAGLGLAIVKSFVEAHDQSIRVEDAAGGGARFVFAVQASALLHGAV